MPFSGEWGCWTDWSSCSVSCGIGIKQRTRVCLSITNRSVESVNCDGSSISEEPCEMPPCNSKLNESYFYLSKICFLICKVFHES